MDLERIRELKKDSVHMLESMREKLDLWERVFLGDAKAMMKFSLISGLITPDQYEEYLSIERELGGQFL